MTFCYEKANSQMTFKTLFRFHFDCTCIISLGYYRITEFGVHPQFEVEV